MPFFKQIIDERLVKWVKQLPPVWLSVICYIFSWLVTYFSIRLIWGKIFKPLNPLIWLISFVLPLCLILGFVFLSALKVNRFRLLVLLPIFMFLLSLVNIFVLKSRLMNYGDVGSLSGYISHQDIFTRWMLGVGLLEFLANNVLGPLLGNLNELVFVKVMSALVMCACSLVVLWRNPGKLRLMFVVTSPMWLLFSTGYDEYYPFIAPVFLLIMLLISEDWMNKLHPIWMGILTALIALSYVGFIPVAIFILIIFAIRRGFKNTLFAAGIVLIVAFIAILLFYGPQFGDFFSLYRGNLNLNNNRILQGKTLLDTPFYNFGFAFSAENFQRLFTQLFWSGSIPYCAILLISLSFFAKRIFQREQINTLAFLGCMTLYQIAYFIFMIPYLGTITDIDLFFSVYLAFAFCSGWLVDQVINKLESGGQHKIRLSMLALCVGSTSVVMVYLMFLGLYQLQ